MPPFAFKDGESFLGHSVTHVIEDRLGELPRKRHFIHCDYRDCPDEELLGETEADFKQAFINARQDHFIRAVARM